MVYLIEWTALLLVSCLTHACRINGSLFIWVQVCSINSVSLCVFIGQCIEGIIGGVDYSQNKVNQWTASIVEHSLTQLVKQGKPFKYIGTSFSIWVHLIYKYLIGYESYNIRLYTMFAQGWKTLSKVLLLILYVMSIFQSTVLWCRKAAQVFTQPTLVTGTLPLTVKL